MSETTNADRRAPANNASAEALAPSTDNPAAIKTDAEAIRRVVDALGQSGGLVQKLDPELAKRITELVSQSTLPGVAAENNFRTALAYAVQDFEKLSGGRMQSVTRELRQDLTQLAASAPGLTNERMKALLGTTAEIDNPALVRELRAAGRAMGGRVDQSGPDVTSRIEVLENKVRLDPRKAEAVNGAQAQAAAWQASPPQASAPRPTAAATALSDSAPSSPRANDAEAGGRATRPAEQLANDGRSAGVVQGRATAPVQGSVLDGLLRMMRPQGPQAPAPWEPPATPMLDRIAAVERFVKGEKDDRLVQQAETSGRAALQALQGFAATEGATVMGKIQAAAQTQPGGMRQVLSEMREGGRFADLRREFSAALADDAGFTAAFDKASSSLAAYGKDRTQAQTILVNRPDASALAQKFEKLDAEIGTAAASTPSKAEGRSLVDDLAKQAADLLHKAVNAVKSVFSRSADATAAASPSP